MFKFLFLVLFFINIGSILCQDAAPTIAEPTTLPPAATTQQIQSTAQQMPVAVEQTTARPYRLISFISDGVVKVLEAKIDFIKRKTKRIESLFSP